MTPIDSGREQDTISQASMAAMSEGERNRLLRRADWRYLLPDPSPERALCLGGAELRDCCRVVASRVDDSPEPGAMYDLVAAENPDDAAMRLMATVLRPGGACYTEWSRVGAIQPRSVRRRLHRAGFGSVRAHHPWPSTARCLAWLPTEGVAADFYWRGAVRSTRVPRERLRNFVGAALARLGIFRRVCVVAFGAPEASEPVLMRVAREQGAQLPIATSKKDVADFLLITLGERVVGKVVLLAFGRDAAPVLAIKTARTAESAPGLEREARLLDAVHTLHPAGMSGVPRVLFRAESLGQPVVGESALVGVPLFALLDERSYPRIAELVTDWASALAAPAVSASPEPVWDRVVAPMLERFATEFSEVVGAERMRRTTEILRTLGPLPVVCEQRDLSPWNVFEGPDGIVVLDWESGEPRGVPALDLIYFVTHASYYLEGAWTTDRFEDAYRAAWSHATPIGRVNHACVARYLARLGLSEEIVAPLRLLAWVIHSHSDYAHLRADAGGAVGAEHLRRSRFLRLFDVELDGIDQ